MESIPALYQPVAESSSTKNSRCDGVNKQISRLGPVVIHVGLIVQLNGHAALADKIMEECIIPDIYLSLWQRVLL
jgi:hypothetical protein